MFKRLLILFLLLITVPALAGNGSTNGNPSGLLAYGVNGGNVAYSPPAISTLSTAVTQGSAGYFLTFANVTTLSAGMAVSGTSLSNNTIINYVAGTSTEPTTTANGAGSGFNVTVTSATGIVKGMIITDTTSGARIANQCTVNFISGSVVTATCSLASVLNTDGLKFYPTIKLSQVTTGIIGSAATITFTSNVTNVTAAAANLNGDLTLGGSINQGANTIFKVTNSTINGDASIPVTSITSVQAGVGALAAATAEGGNTAIGGYAMNTLSGQQGFYQELSFANLGNGSFNTAIGLGAMLNATTSGATASSGFTSFNTVVGAFSGLTLAGGNRNTLIGEANSQNLTTGSFNTIVGSETANFPGSGADMAQNAIVGADTAQSYSGQGSVFMGYNVAENLTTSSFNTMVGHQSGFNMVGASSSDYNTCFGAFSCAGSGTPASNTGIQNTALGAGALFGVTTGSNNTVVGFSVGQTTTTGSNNILIGVSTDVNAPAAGTSNTIVIGGTGGAWLTTTGTNTVSTSATTIGGGVTLTNLTTGTDTAVVCATSANKLIKRAATSCVSSKRSLKENIVSIEGAKAVHDIMALKPVEFKFKQTKPAQSDLNFIHTQYGFIAEDIADTDRNMSIFEDDMKTPHGYRTEAIVSMLVRVVQMQQGDIENMKAINNNPCNAFNSFGKFIMGCK